MSAAYRTTERFLPGDMITPEAWKSWYRVKNGGDVFGQRLVEGDVLMVICDEGGSNDILAVGNGCVGSESSEIAILIVESVSSIRTKNSMLIVVGGRPYWAAAGSFVPAT